MTTTAQKIAKIFGDDGLTFSAKVAGFEDPMTLAEVCSMHGATMREVDGGFIADFRDGSHLSAVGGGWDLCDEEGDWDGVTS
jgi:hypothetical protein